MNSESVRRLESTVLASIPMDSVVTEAELRGLVSGLGAVLNATEEERSAALKAIMARLAITMDVGTALVSEEHRPWLRARKAEITPFFWDRYFKLLERQRWPRKVLLTLDRTTDEILDMLGNPFEQAPWARRGLVVGDVQSGKTGTYNGLVCKAADAGYRLIVLLSGTLENLRRQTQERMDAGFVGFDSSGELKQKRAGKRVGVGVIDQTRHATVFTSRTSDFSTQTVQSLGLNLSSLREPALVVLKKNAKILKNLEEWLRDYNLKADGKIHLPLLLVDDEADNASINTREADADPTAINQRIRSILALFSQSTYVGFTATPFANIFVDPDTNDAMLGDDLFPRDFIYALEPPTNYFGPGLLFRADSSSSPYLREIADASPHLPLAHKKEFEPTQLPQSLLAALGAFLVGNAIKDLRGEGPTHRSMLVNVSRFTDVQNRIEQRLHDELHHYQTDLRNFAGLDPEDAVRNPRVARLREIFEGEYRGCEFDWTEIQRALPQAVLSIETRSVNQRSGARTLDFRAHDETGLRVIAVGGNSLSRGLTLEGLFVSYFHRNSKMYDTLLQMGRWFGYRDGYQDLCRIWLTQEAMDWYAHISEASAELKGEIRRMRDLGLTPADFGLEVRSHPNTLIVTARNKMRSAKEIVREVSVSGRAFESVELDSRSRGSNWQLFREFVRNFEAAGYRQTGAAGASFFHGVPARDVGRLVSEFEAPESNLLFQPRQLADFILESEHPAMQFWDVVIPTGSSKRSERLGSQDIGLQVRRVDERGEVLVVSGSKRRVGSRGAEKAGIPAELIERAEEDARSEKVDVSDRHYRKVRPRPLLLLHVLDAQRVSKRDAASGKILETEPVFTDHIPLVAIGLSFPELADGHGVKRLKYRANVVKLRELFAEEADDEALETDPLETI